MRILAIQSACIVAGLVAVLSVRPCFAAGTDRLPWEGAWQWLHDEQDGRLALTARHFCGVYGAKNRKRHNDGQDDHSAAAQLFRSMPGPFCGSVSYTQPASDKWVVTTTVEVAAHPRNVGRSHTRPTTVDRDRMVGELLNADGSTRNRWHYKRLSHIGGNSELAGVWRSATDGFVGLMIFTDTEYRYVWTDNSRPDITSRTRELTDEEAAILFSTFDAQGGEYSVNGNTLSLNPAVARDPELIGHSRALEYTVIDDFLVLLGLDFPQTWTRIEKF